MRVVRWMVVSALLTSAGCYRHHERVDGFVSDAAVDGASSGSGPSSDSGPRVCSADADCAWACVRGLCDDAVEVAAGAACACARRASGTVVCWGANRLGQLGDGTTDDRPSPVRIPGLDDAVELAPGRYHSCVRRASGAVVCAGFGVYGQLGDGTRVDRDTMAPVVGLVDAVEVTSGGDQSCAAHHACARRAQGTVVCWGWNIEGQVGDGTRIERHAPVAVSGLREVVQISGNVDSTCARRASGTVACWGSNLHGVLGDHTHPSRDLPGAVIGLPDAVQISVGSSFACAIRASGAVVCWGVNGVGEPGTGLPPTAWWRSRSVDPRGSRCERWAGSRPWMADSRRGPRHWHSDGRRGI